jgi:hypothetical protein
MDVALQKEEEFNLFHEKLISIANAVDITFLYVNLQTEKLIISITERLTFVEG